MEHKLHVICGMNASTKYHKQISAYLLMKMFISERAREKKKLQSNKKKKKLFHFFVDSCLSSCNNVKFINAKYFHRVQMYFSFLPCMRCTQCLHHEVRSAVRGILNFIENFKGSINTKAIKTFT